MVIMAYQGVCAKPSSQESRTATLTFTVFIVFLWGHDPLASGRAAWKTFDAPPMVPINVGSSKGDGEPCMLQVVACSDGCITTLGGGMMVVGMVTMTFELHE
jgi:hypothetical protein